MGKKLTYRELEQKVKDLERETARLQRAEKALRENEFVLNEAQRIACTGSWSIDLTEGRQKLSPVMSEIYGVDKDTITLEEGFNLVHPEDRKSAREATAKALAVGTAPLEYRIVRPDGEVRTVFTPGALVIRDENGNPARMIGVSQDVTGRKQAEEALKESEERYRTLFESAAEGIVIADLETRKLKYANPALCKMLGYDKKELMQMGVADIHPEDTLAHVMSEFEAQARGEKTLAPGIPCLRKDGTVIIADINTTSANIGGTKCNVGFFTDITEHKRTEKALKEAYDIVNTSPAVAFLWKNQEGWPVEFVSENVDEVFAYTAEEFTTGKVSYAGIIHPDDRERVLQEVNRYSSEKNRIRFVHEPYRIVTKSGEIRWLDDRTHIRRDNRGNIISYQGIVLDITDRKRAEENALEHQAQLAHFSRLHTLQEMTTELAHEIYQPLCAILTNTHACIRMMRSGSGTVDELVDAMEEVVSQVERANAVVQRIRGFARKREPKKESVDINRILRDSMGMFRAETVRHEIGVELALYGGDAGDPTPLLVRCDALLIETVVANLVRNAIDAILANETGTGELTLGTGITDDGEVEVSIADTGRGISEELADKIFDPFLSTKPEGLGIGLAISRSIVESHDGRLWMESNPHGGSVFRFTLPAA